MQFSGSRPAAKPLQAAIASTCDTSRRQRLCSIHGMLTGRNFTFLPSPLPRSTQHSFLIRASERRPAPEGYSTLIRISGERASSEHRPYRAHGGAVLRENRSYLLRRAPVAQECQVTESFLVVFLGHPGAHHGLNQYWGVLRQPSPKRAQANRRCSSLNFYAAMRQRVSQVLARPRSGQLNLICGAGQRQAATARPAASWRRGIGWARKRPAEWSAATSGCPSPPIAHPCRRSWSSSKAPRGARVARFNSAPDLTCAYLSKILAVFQGAVGRGGDPILAGAGAGAQVAGRDPRADGWRRLRRGVPRSGAIAVQASAATAAACQPARSKIYSLSEYHSPAQSAQA
jgi:hypothetical protein